MKYQTLIFVAALAGCAAPAANTVQSPDGATWHYDATEKVWRDTLGRTTNADPRAPMCKDITLKKDARECVVRR